MRDSLARTGLRGGGGFRFWAQVLHDPQVPLSIVLTDLDVWPILETKPRQNLKMIGVSR